MEQPADDQTPRGRDLFWRVPLCMAAIGVCLYLAGVLPGALSVLAAVCSLAGVVALLRTLRELGEGVEDDPDWWMASGWPDPGPVRGGRRHERRFADDVESWLSEREE